jgi:uncharacterized protein (TIGR02453 family)
LSKYQSFSGFKPEFFKFFRELAKNNNRPWFMENKPRYQQQVVAPMLAFIEAMQEPLADLAPHYRAIPKAVGGSMFRIYRDARFSNDKRPYKEHAAFHFRHEQGKDAHAPGYYLHLEPGNVFFGGGIWVPPAEKLTAIRDTIMDSPSAWSGVKNDPKIMGYGGIQGKGLKTAPRGVDKEHPQIEDLRRKSFFVMREVKPAQAGKADFVDLVAATYKDCEPMMGFICHALEIPF